MKYRVEYTARAEGDLHGAYEYIARDAPLKALRWLESMENAVSDLAGLPERCPRAPESDRLGVDVRQLVRGGYRVLFMVFRRRVVILHIRHGRRRGATAAELGGLGFGG